VFEADDISRSPGEKWYTRMVSKKRVNVVVIIKMTAQIGREFGGEREDRRKTRKKT